MPGLHSPRAALLALGATLGLGCAAPPIEFAGDYQGDVDEFGSSSVSSNATVVSTSVGHYSVQVDAFGCPAIAMTLVGDELEADLDEWCGRPDVHAMARLGRVGETLWVVWSSTTAVSPAGQRFIGDRVR